MWRNLDYRSLFFGKGILLKRVCGRNEKLLFSVIEMYLIILYNGSFGNKILAKGEILELRFSPEGKVLRVHSN